jgi:hypothetical protein
MATTRAWDELFGGGRKWRVAEELTGTAAADGLRGGEVVPAVVTFTRGAFELPAGCAYKSLLSTNLGRRGVVLVETSADGALDVPGSRIAVGEPAVERARREYQAVW